MTFKHRNVGSKKITFLKIFRGSGPLTIRWPDNKVAIGCVPADDDWSAPCDCVAGLHCICHSFFPREPHFWIPRGDPRRRRGPPGIGVPGGSKNEVREGKTSGNAIPQHSRTAQTNRRRPERKTSRPYCPAT